MGAERDGSRPGILVISQYDADIAAIAAAVHALPPAFPPVRWLQAGGAWSAELAEELPRALARAGVVVVRLLTGPEALGGGFELLVAHCRERRVPLVVRRAYPMEQATLAEHSTVPPGEAEAVLAYLLHGGPANAAHLLRYLANRYLGEPWAWQPPRELPWEGYWTPGRAGAGCSLEDVLEAWEPGRPAVGVVCYRNLVQMGADGLIERFVRAIEERGGNALPVFAYGLRPGPGGRDHGAAVAELFRGADGTPLVGAIISLMPFSAATAGVEGRVEEPPGGLSALGVPVVQGAMCQGSLEGWRESDAGLSPLDVAMSAALPELDGRLIAVPAAFHAASAVEGVPRLEWLDDRIERLAGLAVRLARLRVVPNREKRVAVLLNNPNGRESRVAAAFGLDAPASTVRLLGALRASGYVVENIPPDGDALAHLLLDTCPNDPSTATGRQLATAPCRLPVERYLGWYARLPAELRERVEEHWGPPPGEIFVEGGAVVVPGVVLGNVFVGLQSQRGFALNRDAMLHAPDLPPSHQYLAAYLWLREEFGADAVVQVGKHGNLEWLPGKGVGLSRLCYPDVALGDVPLVYPFIVNNPGEGTQAKRRAHAAIVDHLVPPMAEAGAYGELAPAREAAEALREAIDSGATAERQRMLFDAALKAARAAGLERDLGWRDGEPSDAGEFAARLLHYLDELAGGLIPTGLHVLGSAPEGEPLAELVLAIDRGLGERSLQAALARAGLDGMDSARALLRVAVTDGPGAALARLAELGAEAAALGRAPLRVLVEEIVPAIRQATDEVEHTVAALSGVAIPAGPAGAPTRGQPDALPTGRNFYSLDPRIIPTAAAWETGRAMAEAVLERYLAEEGRYPESVAVVAWGTANIRTRGEDIAQVLHLLGVEPRRDARSGRVTGVEVVPLERLGRPRIDVVLRASGFFRDSFACAMALVDGAVNTVAGLDEPEEMNFVRKHLLADVARGMDSTTALYRVFAPRPGAYVDGVVQAVESGHWQTRRDLAEVYAAWVDHAYAAGRDGVPAREALLRRASEVSVVVKTRDNEEHDVLDTDDYFQDFGGMVALAQELGGAPAKAWIGDSTRPGSVTVRTAAEEALRTFRRRAVNPKWLSGMAAHGYQGGSELLKTLEHAFGFDATAGVLEDWMYERFALEYVLDAGRQALLREHNPWALRDMAQRLLEAVERGMWMAPAKEIVDGLREVLLATEGVLEDRQAARPGGSK